MLYVFLSFIALLIIVNIVLVLRNGKKDDTTASTETKSALALINQNIKDSEKSLKDEFVVNRTLSSYLYALGFSFYKLILNYFEMTPKNFPVPFE